MKKIYTLLTMLVVASASFAQSFTVKVGDKVVENMQTVQIAYETFPVEWIVPSVIGIYELDPKIKIIADAEQTMSISISDTEKDGFLQNCFGQCIPVTATNCPVVTSVMINAGEIDTKIHINYGSTSPGNNIDRSINVKISNGTKTVEFTVQYLIGSYALNIKGINSESKADVYTLGGVKVADNAQQSGKIYIKGGKKYVK